VKPQIITFANCVADVRAGKLFVDGRLRKLDALAFDFLVQLLMRKGRVVSKQELVDTVWLGRDVAPEVVSRTAMRLRRSICIDEPSEVIWTIQGRGYRIASGVQVNITMDGGLAMDPSETAGHAASALPSHAWPVPAGSSAMG
jgi:DNA-binding winged helix-turn-helix (wHTH) protein